MMHRKNHASVFDHIHDVVVFGAGYAGLGAVTTLANNGLKVLLVDALGDVAWESGRAMSLQAGQGSTPAWNQWTRHLTDHRAKEADQILPAAAEVLANQSILSMTNLRVLYHVAPLALEMCADELHAVTVATKSGVRRVAGKQFIDATENGTLLRLLPACPERRAPAQLKMGLFFQQHHWADDATHVIHCDQPSDQLGDQLSGARVQLQPGYWPQERCLHIDLPGGMKQPRGVWLAALRAMREQLTDYTSDAVLTHSSVKPLPVYDPTQNPYAIDLPVNVVSASPSWEQGAWDTLALRYELGVAKAMGLAEQPKAGISRTLLNEPVYLPQSHTIERSNVAVAGLGTGGLLAAVAAGRHVNKVDKVVAFDTMPFAGGVGSGAGIHVYYHGVKGGLQQELDERIHQIMPLFGAPGQIMGYHPDARKIVADQMLQEANVTVMQGMTSSVKIEKGRVVSAVICTDDGPVELAANTWIDATGDGDLAALAGASSQLGRHVDGQLHAYSQSSGRANIQNNTMRMFCLNFDAGHVDPTDSQDLTRARLIGISHYLQQTYRAVDYPTSIAPVIGIRQGRLIHTDYTLTLADLINCRQFDDVISHTRSHYDNHAVDYELESDEALFWVWVCNQWRTSLACQVPYRCLLPVGLSNLWLACRALGVSQEAHAALRMQRDIQRIGEVAGLAAALASKAACDSRQIDMYALKNLLIESGGLREAMIDQTNALAKESSTVRVDAATPDASLVERISGAKEHGDELWQLYQAGPAQAGQAIKKLVESDSPDDSWHGAAVAAMWSMPQAQARLCHAIASREYGFDNVDPKLRPESCKYVMPRWVTAVAMLRLCGDKRCLPTLHALAQDPHLVANVRTSIAITLQRLALRGVLSHPQQSQAVTLLNQLLATVPPLGQAPPNRRVLDTELREDTSHGYWQPQVREDFLWQMHLNIARALIAFNQPAHEAAALLVNDERAIVRRAAQTLFANQPMAQHPTQSMSRVLQGSY